MELGQIVNLKIVLQETRLFCAVLSQGSKKVIYFHVRQLEITKIRFKNDVITFNSLFYHCTAQNQDITLKSCIHGVYM